ncbi:uncharacterized protein M421DRAFT_50600 [Didymella exigua CBS 183.55]|uniref:Uncharacterized protein n=1 Tax=Didymella exigua CBS 183.55 TaxID=1150837 RepID=A0A6A5SAF3_9PLEO|nr:uncharacterized protein M421DRAFT_50600 [Didymella exigua CBS 183.55]KAF1934457.1 hypothetical protein M421DRAFT_50600 [Didymella exigua CBS 183.55]
MDADRHNADSYAKYELYFNLLQQKIAQYKVNVDYHRAGHITKPATFSWHNHLLPQHNMP